ncbi:MAG: hypothetical protein KAS17_05225 [Victivallaceae bacterium]|nr:hypothetical protein [Victivallaceae bacterium]
MDKQLIQKMESLLARIEREDKRASASFVVSLVCRVLITLLLVGSLTFIATSFSKLSKPANVAVAINEKILASIPAVHAELKTELPVQAEILAGNTVDLIHKFIPMIGDMLEKQLEIRFDQVMNHYKVQREQIFTSICSRVIDKIIKDKDLVNDTTLAEVLAVQLAAECDREAKNIINNAFFTEIDKLQKRVEQLRSVPDKNMTRSQAAKKHLIACWIYLVDSKGIDEKSIIGNAASLIGKSAENFISSQN